MASVKSGEPASHPARPQPSQKTGSRRGGGRPCRVGGSALGGDCRVKTKVGEEWGSITAEDIIKPGNRILGGGWKMCGKKLNGGKQSLLRPDTKSHSCPSHLTQGRRREVDAVLGCTSATTGKRGRVVFRGAGGGMGGAIFKLGKTVSSSPPWRRQRPYCAGVREGGARGGGG